MRLHTSLLIFISFILCLGCSPERKQERALDPATGPKINQQSFEGTNRAAKAIESSIAVGVNYIKFQELLQNLATEISIATDKIKSPEEKQLLLTSS